jgi:hypothetical protein
MNHKSRTFLGFTACAFLVTTATQAQTIATFDDLTLPTAQTHYAAGLSGGPYQFQSAWVRAYGTKESWGGYGQFNYSNIIDTVTENYTNDAAARAGSGYNQSENYGVAYVSADWPSNTTHGLPIGMSITGDAAGYAVQGLYLNNTTYAYGYMRDYFSTDDYYKVVIKGYLNAQTVPDSVVVSLADYTNGNTTLNKDWEWVSLGSLGAVDSLTFEIYTTDELVPFYFAFDNITTTESCPAATQLHVSTVNENSATIQWNNSMEGYTPMYEIAIDQSATLAPIGTPTQIQSTNHSFDQLAENTLYYVHIRTVCNANDATPWDTVSVHTLQEVGINDLKSNTLGLVLYPNPANNMLNLITKQTVSIAVYNLQGQLILPITHNKTIDISSLAQGMYWLKAVQQDGQQAVISFTKQ